MNHTVTIQNYTYNPATLTVTTGDYVSWTNRDSMRHTATRTDNPAFDTGPITPGTTSAPIQFFAATTSEGNAYSCRPHPFMHGTIIVI